MNTYQIMVKRGWQYRRSWDGWTREYAGVGVSNDNVIAIAKTGKPMSPMNEELAKYIATFFNK